MSNKPKVNNNQPRVYNARPESEIAAALAVTIKKGSSSPNEGSPVPGTSTGGRHRDRCWKYIRNTGRKNRNGYEVHECVFCDYEGRGDIHKYKIHFIHSCPGIPAEIKNSIEQEGKAKGRKYVKHNRHEGFTYMDMDDDYSDLDDDGDPNDDAETKAVEILTRLLGERPDATTIDDCESDGDVPGHAEGGDNKKRKVEKIEVSGDDFERQLKELQVEKMKAELRLINEQLATQGLYETAAKLKIEERKEMIKLYQTINKLLPS